MNEYCQQSIYIVFDFPNFHFERFKAKLSNITNSYSSYEAAVYLKDYILYDSQIHSYSSANTKEDIKKWIDELGSDFIPYLIGGDDDFDACIICVPKEYKFVLNFLGSKLDVEFDVFDPDEIYPDEI